MTMTARRSLYALIFFFVLLHAFRINDAPNGFHKWRETDTASVSRNFFTETTNIFSPRMDVRGSGDGRIGMEFPLYSYVNGFLFEYVSFNHIWSRLLTLAAGCVALYAFFQWLSLLVTVPQALGATMALAFAPLFFFYSRKIQPDVMALMFALIALWRWQLALRKTFASQRSFAPLRMTVEVVRTMAVTAVSLALALLIKPTFFVVGAPMMVALVREKKARALLSPRYLSIAVVAVLPALVWFKNARDLNASLHSRYFFLGNQWDGLLDSLFSRDFFQNLFLTWFWELGIGLALIPFFLRGIKELRAQPQLKPQLYAWFVAAAVSFVLTAHHIASPHDYYALPLVPALAVITGLGISALRTSPSVKVRRIALVLLLLAPVGTMFRLKDRYGDAYDFSAGRAWAAQHLESSASVIAVHKIPAYLLYRLGHKGWHLYPNQGEEVRQAIREGARYLAVSPELDETLGPFRPYVRREVGRADWVVVYELGPEGSVPMIDLPR